MARAPDHRSRPHREIRRRPTDLTTFTERSYVLKAVRH